MRRSRQAGKVIGIGMACLDHLVLWEDVRAPVRRSRILDFDVQGGGMAATALVTVARLGGRAEYWGAVGADPAGDLIVRGLREAGVDTSQVRRVAGRRGPVMVVGVDRRTGERHFFPISGFCDEDRPVGRLSRLRGAACLLVDDTRPDADLRAAREARRLGVPVVADLAWMRAHTRALLPHVDYAIVSEAGARAASGGRGLRRACDALRRLGPPCVVVTLGARGLVYLEGDRFGRLAAPRVEVVDTTGAGDVFHGVFCWGLAEGLALEANLRQASAAAALKCRRLGGRAGIPTRAEVRRFLDRLDAGPVP